MSLSAAIAQSSEPVRPAPWSAPTLEGRIAGIRGAARSLGDLDALEQRVRSEAESAGRAAGLAAAQHEIDARIAALDESTRTLDATLAALSRPLAHVDDVVHEQITRLAVAIARGIVRRELRTDPTQVIGIVRETVALLPASARSVRVLMHPEDAAIVRERLALPQVAEAWSIVEDPVLSRGDCRVVSEHAQIDARTESRLAAVIAELLGDDRELARSEGQS